jgi:hypothetical protein
MLGSPGALPVKRPSGPLALKRTTQSRTICTPTPPIRAARARTTVELRDGQSFAIAGLLQGAPERAAMTGTDPSHPVDSSLAGNDPDYFQNEADLFDILPVIPIRHARRHLTSWMKPKRVAPTMTMFGTKARVNRGASR